MSDWPDLMQGLVKKFGAHVVYFIGLSVLGYPPDWFPEKSAALRVSAALNEPLQEN